MSKRIVGGVVAAAAALALGPMTSPAAACTYTVQQVIDLQCDTSCPYPTKPRLAVYVDGHWDIVCY